MAELFQQIKDVLLAAMPLRFGDGIKFVGFDSDGLMIALSKPEITLFSMLALACIALLETGCLCFFLPWLHIFIASPSGLDFAKEGEHGWVLWYMPVFALLALIAAITGKDYTLVALVAGLVPFVILGYALNQNGHDIIQNIAVGGWAALGLGVTHFVAALK